MKKRYVAALASLTCILIILVSILLIMLSSTPTITAQQAVNLADDANAQVNTLIEDVYVNQTALDIIEQFGLSEQLKGNVSLYQMGASNLNAAHEQLNLRNYDEASTYSLQAMSNFRSSYMAIHQILKSCGLENQTLFDSQSMVEAVQRAQIRIEYLRTIVPANNTQANEQLNQAEVYLNMDVSALIKADNVDGVKANLSQANQLISNVYQNMKAYAQSLDSTRVADYCVMLQQRANQSFSYAHGHGVNVGGVLGQLGYGSENDFNQQLQQKLTMAQNAGNFALTMQHLEQAGNMVTAMNQAMMNAAGGSSNGNGPMAGNGP